MSAIPVVNQDGTSAGTYEVSDSLLIKDKGERVLLDSVLGYQAAQRAGTACTKSKGEVAGSNAKPWKQKGTGRARAGYRQSPVWRGGSVVFGPKPRSYKVQQNKKARQLAYRRALSDAIYGEAVRVMDAFSVPDGKTKQFAVVVKALDIKKNALFIVAEPDEATFLAARNLSNVEIMRARDVHPYHLVRYKTLVASREGMDQLVARLGAEVSEVAA
ncbi:MAG: large subunit ribosomal protein L4 [Candidatus Promineifilaceae bacterium]|jgi:large subunit ribosomal protein L4